MLKSSRFSFFIVPQMIGIFGGTFDPVHYGHIKPALSIKKTLNLSQLRFIPNRIPPHRADPWLNVDQRLQLLKTALSDYPGVMIDERELNREGASYMVDTLASLKKEFPDEVAMPDHRHGCFFWYHFMVQLAVIIRPLSPGGHRPAGV